MGWLVGWAFLSVLFFLFSSFLFLLFLPLCCCFEVGYDHMVLAYDHLGIT